MSAHAKTTVVPIRPPEQLAGTGFTTVRSSSDIEASCLEVPIRALGYRAITDPRGELLKGESFEEDSTTMLLFPQGAVIRLATPVACGHDLMLINKRTNRYVHCRIANVRTSPEVKSYVEVEFTHATSDFWGIWSPKEAVKAVSAVRAFAAQMPAEPPTSAHAESLTVVPAKALAASVGAAPTKSACAVPWPAMESSAAVLPGDPTTLPQPDETASLAPFFLPRPMVAVPLCEPVPEPVVKPVETAPMERAETAPATELMKWEAISMPEPRGNRRTRQAAAAAAALCAILLGYRFYAPAEAALPVVQEAVSSPSSQTAANATVAGTSAAGGPASANIVTAPAPDEIAIVEAPRQRVVLVSKMTAPVAHSATTGPHDAPELLTTATLQPNGDAPGKAAGLLAATGAVVPPPVEPEKRAELLTPAHLVSSVQPVYPEAAKRAQIQGDVVVEATIDASGSVTGMKIVSGPQALRVAATAALAKWKFEPARLGDKPTASTSTVTVHFRLK